MEQTVTGPVYLDMLDQWPTPQSQLFINKMGLHLIFIMKFEYLMLKFHFLGLDVLLEMTLFFFHRLLQSMRNKLRQNFQERQKTCLPSLSHSCYYDVDGIGDTTSFICVKETVVACSTVEWPLILSSSLLPISPWAARQVTQVKSLWRWRSEIRVGEWVVT